MSAYTPVMRDCRESLFVPTLLEVIDEDCEYDFSSESSPESSINTCFLQQIFEVRPAYNFIDPMEICSTVEEETPKYRSFDLISDDLTMFYLENERKEAELKKFYELIEPASKPTHADFLKEQFKRFAFEPLHFSFPTYQVSDRLRYIMERMWYDEEILRFEVEASVAHEKYSKISFADYTDITICDGLKWGPTKEIKKDIKPMKSCLRSKTNPHYEQEIQKAVRYEEGVTVEELEEYCDYLDESHEDEDVVKRIMMKMQISVEKYYEEISKEEFEPVMN